MPFIRFSTDKFAHSDTHLSNVFINEYLPAANGDCVRVYIYGLYLGQNPSWRYDNNLTHFADVLQISKDDVIAAFTYWQAQGLVRLKSTDPIEVVYETIQSGTAPIKNKNKYTDFNLGMEGILGDMLHPRDFKHYYDFLETYGMEPEAMLEIAKFCKELKEHPGRDYVLKVSKDFLDQGTKSAKVAVAMIEQRKKEMQDQAEAKAIRAAKRTAKTKKMITHSYKDGEIGKDKFKDTDLDEVEL